MRKRQLLTAVFVGLIVTCPHAGSAMEAKEIMRRVERQNSAADEVVQLKMTLIDTGGRRHVRTATFYQKQKNDVDDMRLIRFHSPPDLAENGVLTIENSNRDNDQWTYLPAYHTVRRIAPANRSDTYMGTDFAYEDVTDRKLDEYQFKILGKEEYKGNDCVIIESLPAAPKLKKETGYTKIISWVDPVRYVIFKEEYYDRNQRLFKILTNANLQKYDSKFRFQRMEMVNVQTNHHTVIEANSRKINSGISDRIFTVRYLKRGK